MNEQAEARRIARERAILEAVLQGQLDPVLAVDQDLVILFANRSMARLAGAEGSAELIGRQAGDVLESSSLLALLRRGVESRRPTAGTYEVTREQHRTYQVTVTPLEVEVHGVRGAVAVLHDQTALRRLERIRSDFIANVSHELRTPLTAVHGFIETLQNGSYKNPERLKRYLAIMHGETTRVIALINDLLHLSSLESPDKVLNLERVDMRELAASVVELYRRPAETKGIALSIKAPRSLPRVMADPALIRQALLNLVDNAVKYTEPGGSVTVGVERDEGGVRVIVTDTGVGIPPDSLDRVFERFYRVDKARSRKEGGTGLGLSIVKHTIEKHQGRLGIASTPGQGTTIWFSLPLSQRNPHVAAK